MTTASGTLQDHSQRAAALRDSMAAASKDGRNAALRDLAAQCLGLSAVNRPAFAVKDENLPGAADIIAAMTNDQGCDIIAVHFDLTAVAGGPPSAAASATLRRKPPTPPSGGKPAQNTPRC